MGLINQEDVPALRPLSKEALQLCIRIKYIIVIAQDCVAPAGGIECEFERADPAFHCHLHNGAAVKNLPFLNQVKYGFIDPVKMSFGKHAVIRIAGGLVKRADLLFGSDPDRPEIQPPIQQYGKCLRPDRQGFVFGSQVKNPVPVFFANGPHRRKYAAHRLADTGWRHEKQFFRFLYRMVHGCRQLLLACSVREREIHVLHGCVSQTDVFQLPFGPAVPVLYQFPVPLLDLRARVHAVKMVHFLRLKVHIGHPHPDPAKSVPVRTDRRIAFGLGQMHRKRFLQSRDIQVHPLNLIHNHRRLICLYICTLRGLIRLFICSLRGLICLPVCSLRGLICLLICSLRGLIRLFIYSLLGLIYLPICSLLGLIRLPGCSLRGFTCLLQAEISDDSVRAALDPDYEVLKFRVTGQHHFGGVIPLLRFLELPVDSSACERRLHIHPSLRPRIQVAGAQQEFHQSAHGNPGHGFWPLSRMIRLAAVPADTVKNLFRHEAIIPFSVVFQGNSL